MDDGTVSISLHVNEQAHTVEVAPSTPLMFVLRNDLGLKGVRAGCSIGECGSCRVIIDGTSTQSCITPVSEVADARIVTPEGLGGPEDPHPVQQAFLTEQAGQCGYCVNGMIMSVAALVESGSAVDGDELVGALDEHICRCGTHHRMLRAGFRAAGLPVEDDAGTVGAGNARTLAPCASAPIPDALRDAPRVDQWLDVTDDGRVVARPGKVELGQGLRTALAQIVASQLDLPIEHVRVEGAATDRSPDQGQTSGSFSIEHAGVALGMAATTMRRVLLERAARHLGADAGDLEVRDGRVVCATTDTQVSFAELRSTGPVTDQVEDTDLPRWNAPLLGQPVARDDLRRKLTGAPAYLQDLAVDGMLHARVFLPPTLDAEPEHLDLDAARRIPGVEHVVHESRIVIVVAAREEQAVRAVARLANDTRWKRGPGIVERDTEQLLRGLPAQQHVRRRDDDAGRLLESRPRVSATYLKPYEAHGPMSPSTAVAVEQDGSLRVRSHTQGVHPLRRELAALLDLDEDRIVVEHVDGPGCYGLTASDDAAAFSAIAARALPGRPIRLQLSIADEFTWEPHGPGMVADLTAALDDGRIVAWRHRGISDSHSTRANGDGDRLMAAWLGPQRIERPWVGLGEPALRNALPPYEIPALDICGDDVRGPLRTGPLRSLGAFLNVFAVESFMDELAETAGSDPVTFRLDHLRDERARCVIEVAAERAGWEPRVGPSGRGFGIAFARYKDTKGYAATVAEVEVDTEAGGFRVARLIIACDVGVVVNADGLRNQMEGGLLQGLSRTLFEELHLTDTGVRERDWSNYGTLRFKDVPQLDVVLVDRPECPPLGAGEVATPLVPAAVANALDDAVGIRLRRLPLTPAGLQRRLLEMDDVEMQRVRI